MNEVELHAQACALAGHALEPLRAVRGGGNNRLFHARSAGRTYALKRYPDDPHDARERFGREFAALTFLWNAGERRIPEPVALDARRHLALFGWIDGTRPGVDDRSVDNLIAFMRDLHGRRTLPGAEALASAREAVFSRAELEGQVARRLERLAPAASTSPALAALLRDIAHVFGTRRTAGTAPLPPERRTLSPSDFGLHNALRTAGGLVFLDFEYFGWDDPVKLVADVLWHPGQPLGALGAKVFAAATDSYGVDDTFERRFESDAPLYGLRWALIVLNEFLPEVWQRRVAAGETGGAAAARDRQLEKAHRFVARVRAGAIG